MDTQTQQDKNKQEQETPIGPPPSPASPHLHAPKPTPHAHDEAAASVGQRRSECASERGQQTEGKMEIEQPALEKMHTGAMPAEPLQAPPVLSQGPILVPEPPSSFSSPSGHYEGRVIVEEEGDEVDYEEIATPGVRMDDAEEMASGGPLIEEVEKEPSASMGAAAGQGKEDKHDEHREGQEQTRQGQQEQGQVSESIGAHGVVEEADDFSPRVSMGDAGHDESFVFVHNTGEKQQGQGQTEKERQEMQQTSEQEEGQRLMENRGDIMVKGLSQHEREEAGAKNSDSGRAPMDSSAEYAAPAPAPVSSAPSPSLFESNVLIGSSSGSVAHSFVEPKAAEAAKEKQEAAHTQMEGEPAQHAEAAYGKSIEPVQSAQPQGDKEKAAAPTEGLAAAAAAGASSGEGESAPTGTIEPLRRPIAVCPSVTPSVPLPQLKGLLFRIYRRVLPLNGDVLSTLTFLTELPTDIVSDLKDFPHSLLVEGRSKVADVDDFSAQLARDPSVPRVQQLLRFDIARRQPGITEQVMPMKEFDECFTSKSRVAFVDCRTNTAVTLGFVLYLFRAFQGNGPLGLDTLATRFHLDAQQRDRLAGRSPGSATRSDGFVGLLVWNPTHVTTAVLNAVNDAINTARSEVRT